MQTTRETPNYDRAPFERGSGQWAGVVMIERPNERGMCRVISARTTDYNGLRAICTETPWALAKQFFALEDEGETYRYAEFKDGHLEYYERASQIEFFITAAGAQLMYPCGGRQV